MTAPYASVCGVTRSFRGRARGGLGLRRRRHVALDGVSLDISRGEATGLVGGSGSGKSTLARIFAGLLAPDSGELRVDGERIAAGRSASTRALWRRVQYVHQNPRGALNPRHRVGEIVGAPLGALLRVPAAERAERVARALQRVGLDPDAAERRPHAFSGGEAQRIAIARALAAQPELLILDEPTSALDVRRQAGVIALLSRMRDELGTTLLFVSHDLPIVAALCSRVAVLDRGRLVEQGRCARVFAAPEHPSTQRLLDSLPALSRGSARRPPDPRTSAS